VVSVKMTSTPKSSCDDILGGRSSVTVTPHTPLYLVLNLTTSVSDCAQRDSKRTFFSAIHHYWFGGYHRKSEPYATGREQWTCKHLAFPIIVAPEFPIDTCHTSFFYRIRFSVLFPGSDPWL